MENVLLLGDKCLIVVEETCFIVNLFYDEKKESVLEKVGRLLKEEIQEEYED